jgi:hypothetical protein
MIIRSSNVASIIALCWSDPASNYTCRLLARHRQCGAGWSSLAMMLVLDQLRGNRDCSTDVDHAGLDGCGAGGAETCSRRNLRLRRSRQLEQAVAVGHPAKLSQRQFLMVSLSLLLLRWNTIDSAVATVAVVIDPEGRELAFEVKLIPEQCLVQQLLANRPDHAFNEGMRNRGAEGPSLPALPGVCRNRAIGTCSGPRLGGTARRPKVGAQSKSSFADLATTKASTDRRTGDPTGPAGVRAFAFAAAPATGA